MKRARTAGFALALGFAAAARADGPPDPASLVTVAASVAPGASPTQGTLVLHAKIAPVGTSTAIILPTIT